MKFKDLEEGKEYRGRNIRWKFVNDTLFCYLQDDWIVCQWKYNELLTIDFEEVIEYVSFREAVEHMKKGGKAKFEGIEFFISNTENICVVSNHYKAYLNIKLLEPKWILL